MVPVALQTVTKEAKIICMSRYGYFDHDADIGIIGRGETVEAAFESAAEAMFAIMYESRFPVMEETVCVTFDEEDTELALVRWLNLLLAHAQSRSLVLGRFQIKREASHWSGIARGTPWRKEMPRGVEVKGATLTMLSVTERAGLWEARCIVDV